MHKGKRKGWGWMGEGEEVSRKEEAETEQDRTRQDRTGQDRTRPSRKTGKDTATELDSEDGQVRTGRGRREKRRKETLQHACQCLLLCEQQSASALGTKAKRRGCRRKGQGQPSLSRLG